MSTRGHPPEFDVGMPIVLCIALRQDDLDVSGDFGRLRHAEIEIENCKPKDFELRPFDQRLLTQSANRVSRRKSLRLVPTKRLADPKCSLQKVPTYAVQRALSFQHAMGQLAPLHLCDDLDVSG
jgi:hypothetical protein